MNFPLTLVGLLALYVPALLVYFLTIERIEKRLEERKLYLAFGGVVILAAVVTMVEFLSGMRLEGNAPGVISLVAQPTVHIMVLVMALNHQKMRATRQNSFYGAGLGLSFGATYATLVLMAEVQRAQGADESWLTFANLPLLLPGLLGLTLFLGAQGTYIGKETHKASQLTFVLRAWAPYAVFTVGRFFWYRADDIFDGNLGVFFKGFLSFFLLAVGAIGYQFRYQKTLKPIFLTRRTRIKHKAKSSKDKR